MNRVVPSLVSNGAKQAETLGHEVTETKKKMTNVCRYQVRWIHATIISVIETSGNVEWGDEFSTKMVVGELQRLNHFAKIYH